MATKEKVDPTLPFTLVTVDGETYKLCLDFEAIAKVEDELVLEGHKITLIIDAWSNSISSVRALFAASLRIYQPEIGFEQARKMVTWENSLDILLALRGAREAFMPAPKEPGEKDDEDEEKEADPTTPGD